MIPLFKKLTAILLILSLTGPSLAWSGEPAQGGPVAAAAAPPGNPGAERTVASYFFERFRNEIKIDDAHLAAFQRDFAATVAALDRAHAFTSSRILWDYWKDPKNQSEFLNSADIRAKYGELSLGAMVGLVWSKAVEARAARIQDARRKRDFIVRSYFAFVDNPTVRAFYTNSAVVFGWEVVKWAGAFLGTLGTASLMGSLYAISGGMTNNALNPVLRPMMDWLARWAPNNLIIRFLARHSQRVFTPQESVKAEKAAGDAKASLRNLAEQLERVSFQDVSDEQARSYWNRITHQFSEANLSYISGLPGYLKDGRNFRNDALTMRPLAFSQGITVQLTHYEQHHAGLEALRGRLHEKFGIPLVQIREALRASGDFEDEEGKDSPRDRVELLRASAHKARDELKRLGREAILKASSDGGPAPAARMDEVSEKISLMEAEVDRLFEHQRSMKQSARSAGAVLAAWLDHNNSFTEYYWKNAPDLAETARRMAQAMGMDFFRQMDLLRPHFQSMFARLSDEIDSTLDSHLPKGKKRKVGGAQASGGPDEDPRALALVVGEGDSGTPASELACLKASLQ